MSKTLLNVEYKDGTTTVSNNQGQEWQFEGLSPYAAIATLVYSTLLHRYDRLTSFSEHFSMTLTLEEFVKDERG